MQARRIPAGLCERCRGGSYSPGVSVTVLVVEDEVKIRDLVRRYLEREDLTVVTTGSGAEALSILERGGIDLVVLDLNLPDVSGETVAAELHGRVPTVMLTAKSAEQDRIRGLELGADDYVTKPFSPRELVLRVQAVLRRSRQRESTSAVSSFGDGALVIDEAKHTVVLHGEPVEVTPTEWSLLTSLASSPGRVFSRGELINRVRGYEFDGYERTVDSHVKNLRRKLEVDPRDPVLIETVLGAGYRLGVARDRG